MGGNKRNDLWWENHKVNWWYTDEAEDGFGMGIIEEMNWLEDV